VASGRALFYADAVQALGMFPADVRDAGVDCLTCGTYKWPLGRFGVAPFFIRRELVERIRVDRLGALHVEKELGDHRYEIYRTAKKFEYATLPFAEVYQLGAALTYLGDHLSPELFAAICQTLLKLTEHRQAYNPPQEHHSAFAGGHAARSLRGPRPHWRRRYGRSVQGPRHPTESERRD
jgi:selenocysteine lyase/cysteine desulfurase